MSQTKNWTMLIDIARCHDCNNCFLACKDEYVGNDWPPYSKAQPWRGQRWLDILRREGGQYPKVRTTYVPLMCQHCTDGPCQTAGPEGAVYKRPDGLVIIDPEKAAGHKEIADACPYHAVYWNEEAQLPQKCTGCVHLLENGWKDTRCTQACPTGALKLVWTGEGEFERLLAEGYEPLYPEMSGGHRVLYANLHRWQKLFLAGSVAARDTDECAEGATVALESRGRAVARTTTDNYGDFWFEGLEASGVDRIVVTLPGYADYAAPVSLQESLNLGTILLDR
jgi:Fe-S-cluster-containing dehydrogenase component